MKKLITFCVIFFTFSACDNKSCEEIVCGNNQECYRGVCGCINGYEGTNCEDLASQKYLGNFNITQSCQQGNGMPGATFGTIFADGSPVNELTFNNFLGLGHSAFAYIITDRNGNGNYIQFPDQNLGATQIAGEGFYQDLGGTGRLSIDIQIIQNTQSSLCTYTYY